MGIKTPSKNLMHAFRQKIIDALPQKEIAEFLMAHAFKRVFTGARIDRRRDFLDQIELSDFSWILATPEVAQFYTCSFAEKLAILAYTPSETKALICDKKLPEEIRVALWVGTFRSVKYSGYRFFHQWFNVSIKNPLIQCHTRKHIDFSKQPRQKLPPQLYDAIQKDSFSSFEMLRLIHNKPISISLVQWILFKRAFKIFIGLVPQLITKDKGVLLKLCTFQDLLLYICAYCDEATSLHLLPIIHHDHPDLIQTARDEYGNNALWYAYHNPHKSETLIEFLKAAGCDPNAYNEVHLNYSMLSRYEPIRDC